MEPTFFLSDFSDAKFSALKQVFPATTVYGCDFHRERAWTRWVQDRKNALDSTDASHLLDLIRACAWAPPGTDDMDLDANYQKVVSIYSGNLQCGRKMHMFKVG